MGEVSEILANADSCSPGVTLEKFRFVAEIAHPHGASKI
jgi:hypothetical protein